MKEINVDSHSVPATARSRNYQTALATTASSGGGATTPSTTTPTGGAADTAKVAQNLAEDSTDWAKILRKDIDERTENSLSIGKDITVNGQAILNDVVANTGTFGGLLKAAAATITGALLASTVSATTINATTFIGELQGNAATATKLQTPRTIWGQSFDGSGNINGLIKIQGNSKQTVLGGDYTCAIRLSNLYAQTFGSGGEIQFGISDTDPEKNLAVIKGIYTDWSNFVLGGSIVMGTKSVQDGLVHEHFRINSVGNIGIGTTSPAYKLDVNGTFHASGAATLDSGLTVTGNILATGNVGIGTTTPQYKLDVNGTFHAAGSVTLSSTLTAAGLITANGGTQTTALTATALSTLAATDILGDAQLSARVMSPDYVSQTKGWGITRAGAADFRNIYADELRVQAFTADISQALAGSDYLTKSVSKLSANFVVPSVSSTVRIIVDDIEGMPSTQCFANGDYIRFRAFNRTSGLTIANVWGTVTLDTTYGTKGFSNGTQAYTFTCKATTGAGLTVFKGSEVLDYGISGSGLITRTTLDTMGSPYEQIATWVNDPSNGNNYTVHARLGNLNGIANCNGYGLYTDNGFFTGKIIIGDLTKTANFLSFDTVNGLQIKLGGTSVATTTDVNNSLTTANTNAQGYATTAQTNAINTASSDATTKANTAYSNAATYTNTQISATNNSITAAVNGIQIGGRNLFLGTQMLSGPSFNGTILSGATVTLNDYINFTSVAHSYPTTSGQLLDILAWNNKITPSQSTPYTLSFYAKSTINGDILISHFYPNYNGQGSDGLTQNILTTSWKKYVIIWTTGPNITGPKSIIVGRLTTGKGTGIVSVCGVKFHRGNKVEDWSPAPEDIDANIATAQSTAISTAASNASLLYVTQTAYSSQVTILQNSINSKVSQTDFNALNTRVGTAESNITQNANAITTKVSQTTFDALGTRVSTAESNITQNTTDIGLKVSKDGVIGAINLTSETATIQASKINLVGAVTITDLDKTSVTPSALGAISTDASNAPNSLKNSSVSIGSDGTLNNAGGGKVTIGGLGYTGALDATKGATWGTNLLNIPTTLGTPSAVGLYLTATSMGYWNGTAFKTYMDNVGNFKCGDPSPTTKGLSWNQPNGTLVIGGEIYVTGGNAATTTNVSDAITTAATDATNKVTALSNAHGGLTYLDAHSIYTGTLTAGQVNAVAINASSVTTGTLSADRIAANSLDASKIVANSITSTQINASSVSTAIATVISLDAGRITTGKLSADRIDSVSVVTKGIAAQTIDAQSATIKNLKMETAEVSGKITASVIGYTASTVNNGLVNGCLLVGDGNYILPTLPSGKCVEYTLFNPQMTRTIANAHISGQGKYDKFLSSDAVFANSATSYVDLTGYHKIVGIGGMADYGGTLWVYN